MVPYFASALTATPSELEQHILNAEPAIERWFRLEFMEISPPFYCSANLRDAGFKLAPTDTDLFPNHWDSLSPETLALATQAAQATLRRLCPDAKGLLLIPENRAPSLYYWHSVLQLQGIFKAAGLQVQIGSIDPKIKADTLMTISNGEQLLIKPVLRQANRLVVEGFDPCAILLNHELVDGIPGILEDLEDQHLLPPMYASQSLRLKSKNYAAYDLVSKRFSKLLGIDPWLISPLFNKIDTVDLTQDQILESLQASSAQLLNKISKKHKEFDIPSKTPPFVVIKTDHGNSESSTIAIRHPNELNSMEALKPLLIGEQKTIPPLVMQEGVHGVNPSDKEKIDLVTYMIDRYVVGGFYKLPSLFEKEGQHLSSEAPHSPLTLGCAPSTDARHNNHINRFYMYGVVSRLAMLATAYELENNSLDIADTPETDVGNKDLCPIL